MCRSSEEPKARYRDIAFASPVGSVERGAFYVYRLIQDEEIVYVGQSRNLINRLTSHGDKQWTIAQYEQCATKSEVNRREGLLIHELHPKYNKMCPICGVLPGRVTATYVPKVAA